PASGFAPTLAFTSRGLLSVTGWGHGGGRYSQLLRVVSSSSKRRLVEPLLLGCGLVSRPGLRGGGPLVAATRARPVLLGVVPLLALRRRARRGLALLDRDDAEAVGGRLRPLLLLAGLVRVLARLLRPSDRDDRALHECRVLSVTTKQGHVMERHPAVLPLLRLPVLCPEVLGDRERCAGLPIVAVLDLRVSGETTLKSDLCQSVSPVCWGVMRGWSGQAARCLRMAAVASSMSRRVASGLLLSPRLPRAYRFQSASDLMGVRSASVVNSNGNGHEHPESSA